MDLTPREVASRLRAETMIAARHAWHQYYSRFHTTSQANAAAEFVASAIEEMADAIRDGWYSDDKARLLIQAIRQVCQEQVGRSGRVFPTDRSGGDNAG